MTGAIVQEDLKSVLERVLGAPVLHLSHRPFDYSSSFAMEEIEVTTKQHKYQLLLKAVGPDSMLSGAALVKPNFLHDPLREINVYSRLLPLLDAGTPKLYGEIVDESTGRYWLILEKVNALRLWEIGDFEVWLEAARWLAAFHAAAPSAPEPARNLVPELLEQDPCYWRSIFARAYSLLGARLRTIEDVQEHVVSHLHGLPRTLIHGEFYPSNILVADGCSDLRISPVDWEMAAIGPGILDIAALASGNWTRESRLSIAQEWYEALPERLRPADLVTAFDCAQLQIALQWLGWSTAWTPPPEHVCDWLAEALRITALETIAALGRASEESFISE